VREKMSLPGRWRGGGEIARFLRAPNQRDGGCNIDPPAASYALMLRTAYRGENSWSGKDDRGELDTVSERLVCTFRYRCDRGLGCGSRSHRVVSRSRQGERRAILGKTLRRSVHEIEDDDFADGELVRELPAAE
jgi:hypothetical protein